MQSLSIIKKSTLTILVSCVLFQTSVVAQDSGYWQQIKDTTALSRDFVLDWFSPSSTMGSNPLSPEVDAEVRQILTSIGFQGADTIRLRQLSAFAMGTVGEKTAIAFGIIGLPKYMFIAENWFKTLSNDQKRFLITHKAANIAQHHFEINAAAAFLLGHFLTKIVTEQVANTKDLYNGLDQYPAAKFVKTVEFLEQTCLNVAQFLAIAYPAMLLHRATQYEADAIALETTQALDGGLSLLKTWNDDAAFLDSELPQWKIMKWLRKIKNKYFSTNAPFEDRIAALQELDAALAAQK